MRYSDRNQIFKSQIDKKLSGVCAGLANYFDLPAWGVRAGVIVSLFMFPMVTGVAYITAAILLPTRR